MKRTILGDILDNPIIDWKRRRGRQLCADYPHSEDDPPSEAQQTLFPTRVSGRNLDLLLVNIYRPFHHSVLSEIR